MAPGATAAQVQSLVEQIYRLNRQTIGSDPDLIRPGQFLSLPEDCRQ
jgi:nucleoid-associated protein YgaU